MIKPISSLQEVKQKIVLLKDKRVFVKVNLGRNKVESFFGVLKEVYPALFTVAPENQDYRGKTTYSYNEYMCGEVKIKPAEK